MQDKDPLDVIRELCDEATPGPWTVSEGYAGMGYSSVVVVRPGRQDLIEFGPLDECNNRQDAAFVANARTALSAVLADVDHLKKELERLKAIEATAAAFCDGIDRGELPTANIYMTFKELLSEG